MSEHQTGPDTMTVGPVMQELEAFVVTKACRHGDMAFFSFDGPIGDSLARYGEWAGKEVDFLCSLVSAGGTVIDGGANIGTHTVALARHVGPSGSVIAIEPQPQVFELLNRNIRSNGLTAAKAVHAALAMTAGSVEIPLLDAAARSNVGAFSLLQPIDTQIPKQHYPVPVITLDSLGLSNVDLIKLDVESMELDTLRGACETLRRCRPILYLECNHLELGWDLVSFLREEGYRAWFCRFPAFNTENYAAEQDNIFGVAEESSLLFVPNESAAPNLQSAPHSHPITTLDELVDALLKTLRYHDPVPDSDHNDALDPELARYQCGLDHEHTARVLARTVLADSRPQAPLTPCASTYDILIPIYNAYEHVERCVESVLQHTDPAHGVILLDDASTDVRILLLLHGFAARDARVRVVEATYNLGFVGNMNRGFSLSLRDVVILNSDTEVTPGWLERLDRCRLSRSDIGIVSPLSNNATILSVPRFNAANRLPAGMDAVQFAKLVDRVSPRSYPLLPTAVGFCMLITRATLNRIGVFDTAFGLGYGEESDLCMRARRAGIETVCCDDAYVHHYGEASFNSVKQIGERRLKNANTLAQRWPYYHSMVEQFCAANPLRLVQERIQTALRALNPDGRIHVLQVMHSFDMPGGTELHTRQIIDRVASDVRTTVLYPKLITAGWTDIEECSADDDLRVLGYRKQNVPGTERFIGNAGGLQNELAELSFARLIAGGDYDTVHFQHLAHWDTLRLPLIAKALGLRVVISLHDYYLLCPEYNLITPEYRRCGKARAEAADAECLRCLSVKYTHHGEGFGIDLAAYADERHALLRRVLETADELVAPTAFVQQQFERAFGVETAGRIRVIGHGVEISRRSPRPTPIAKLRVGFLGNLTDRKGGYVLLDVARRLRTEAVRFEVFGGITRELQTHAESAGLVLHGNYTRGELPGLLQKVDLIVIASVWDETFCLTVSEAQAMGVPVLAVQAGGIAERVSDGSTGWLVPPGDAKALADKLLELAADRTAITAVAHDLETLRIKTIDANAQDYRAMYHNLRARKSADTPINTTNGSAPELTSPSVVTDDYLSWVGQHATTPARQRRLQAQMENWDSFPSVHLLTLCAPDSLPRLAQTLDSLAGQLYRGWGLTVVGNGPCPDDRLTGFDNIEWYDGGKDPLAAVNRAVADTGADWVAVLGCGDRLADTALVLALDEAGQHPDWQMLYSDEDRMGTDGRRSDADFKPDFNADLLRADPYLGGFCLYRREAWSHVAGIAVAVGAHNHDLAFKLLETYGESAIGHVSQVLCHRAPDAPLAADLSPICAQVLQAHLQRIGVTANIEGGFVPGSFFIDYYHAHSPRVSIIIPTRDRLDLLQPCLETLLKTTDYSNYEVIVVDNDSCESATLAYLNALPAANSRIRVIRHPGDFNFSAINNAAAHVADGDYLLLLNNDTLVLQPNWLTRMLAHAQRDEVGIVGARLIFLDQRLQHAGMVLGMGPLGIADHCYYGMSMQAVDLPRRAQLVQNLSAVSGACLLIRKSLYHELGGLDETMLPTLFNDVDLCLRVADRGLKLVWTPFATLVHHGGSSVQTQAIGSERVEQARRQLDCLRQRWGARLGWDPAYNRHLSLVRLDAVVETELQTPWVIHDSMSRLRGLGFGSYGSWQFRVNLPLQAMHADGCAEAAALAHRDIGARLPTLAELSRDRTDVLLMHNTVHDVHIAALKDFRRHGKSLLVFGQDDLMYALPPKNPFHKTVFKDIKKRLRTCLSLCDRLVVTTDALANGYRDMIDDIRVVPNYLPRSLWGDVHTRFGQGRRPRVGWAGALQHAGDLEVLFDVIRTLADEVEWVFMGMCPEPVRMYMEKIYPAVTFADYPASLAALDLDLALAPLELNRFNEAKSNLRVLEYGALGLPVITTDIEPYRSAPVRRVANKSDAWIDAIREYINDPVAAQAEGARLRDWVMSGWMLEDHLDVWLAALGCGMDMSGAVRDGQAQRASG